MDQRLQLLLFVAALLGVHGVAVAAASSAGAAAMPGLHVLRRVEEDTMMSSLLAQGEDEVAYPKRRVLQGGNINYGALTASKAACYGPCPARGQPYSGRGCQQIYQCRG